jgi:hypothetical protein
VGIVALNDFVERKLKMIVQSEIEHGSPVRVRSSRIRIAELGVRIFNIPD